MKILLINGSPHKEGTTFKALSEMANTLEKEGIETEIFHIGNKPIQSCQSCGYCFKEKKGCVFQDGVNTVYDNADQYDGFVFGSPVHYAGISGAMKCFLDRLFYAGSRKFAYKPCAVVVCARRAGTTAALEQLNKYPVISNMLLVGSQYWPMAFGAQKDDIYQDNEGLQIMRTMAKSLAWSVKSIEIANIEKPEIEKKEWTNFIR